jgi:hypothetical protein
MIARGVGVLCQFLVIKLYATHLPAEQLGYLYFLFTLSYVLNGLLLVPFDLRLQPLALDIWNSERSLGAISGLQIRLGYFLLAFAGLAEICIAVIKPEIQGVALALTLLSWGLYWVSFVRRYLNNIGQQWPSTLLFFIEPLFRAITLSLFAFSGLVTARVALWSTAISYGSLSLITIIWMGRRGWLKKGANELSLYNLAKQSIPFGISGIGNLIQLQGYRLALVPCGFATEVGIFALVSQFGFTATTSVGAIYSQVTQPAVYRDQRANLAGYLRGVVLLVIGIFLMLLLGGPLLIRYATKTDYMYYAPLMLVGVLCEGANLVIGAYGIRAAVIGKTSPLAVSAIWGVTVFAVAFLVLFFCHQITPWTMGVPLVLSQAAVVAYLWNYYNEKNR